MLLLQETCLYLQGATAPFISPWPTKLLMFGEDMQSDQLHVPAFFGHSKGPSLEPNHNIIQFAALLSQSGINFEIYKHQNLPQIFAETISPTVLWLFDIFSPRSCRRRTLGLFGNNRRNIIWDFHHAGQNSMDSGFNYVWQYWMPYIVFEKFLMWLLY